MSTKIPFLTEKTTVESFSDMGAFISRQDVPLAFSGTYMPLLRVEAGSIYCGLIMYRANILEIASKCVMIFLC